MNWFNNLVMTYDNVHELIGIPDEKGNVLLPVNHMSAKSDVCVTINGSGEFLRAEESVAYIPIPCTEESASRTGSSPNPHPLHEQLGYLAFDKNKVDAYSKQLEKFSVYNKKAASVLNYIHGGTLVDDLKKSGIKKADEPKLFVRFAVEIPSDLVSNLWEDMKVSAAWQKYLSDNENRNIDLCYISGEIGAIVRKNHGGIYRNANSAKLISCNGNEQWNFTYRGRFTLPEQANSIGAEPSDKAQAMLKYLIETQGYKCDTQAIVAWATDTGEAAPAPFASTKTLVGVGGETQADENEEITDDGLEDDEEDIQTDNDKLIIARVELAIDYAVKLRNALSGNGNAQKLNDLARQIAVIAVDAATTGRMSVTFYQDMPKNNYIERIIAWHESCCWRFRKDGIEYISAPSADRIIAAVYGEPKGEGYNKIKKQARERILHNIICGEKFSRAWISAAVNRVSVPFSYDKKDGGWNRANWLNAISVTCAVVRKYYGEKREDFSLELETERHDRDYLYGRLLAFADKIESHARFLQNGKDNSEKRPTNAVRYMSAFAVKPFGTWPIIYKQLNPYIQRLNGAEWYQRQIDEITGLFNPGEFESDKPLNGKYLLGYSLQRRVLNQKNKEEKTENEPYKEN